MKKMVLGLIATVFAGVALAGGAGSYSFTGSSGATGAIPAKDGTVVAQSCSYSAVSNTTVTLFRAKYVTKMFAAAASISNLIAVTTIEGSNNVHGASGTAGTDYLLFRHSGSSGYQLRLISSISDYQSGSQSNVTTYSVPTAITVAAGDPVYFVDVDDNVSIPIVAAQSGTPLGAAFTSLDQMPIFVSIPGVAGATVFSGTYTVE